MVFKILRLFVHTLSAIDKYSSLNGDNLMQPIQMELSGKQKNFCKFFSTFLKSHLNFEHFEKSDDSHRLFVSEVTPSKERG